MPDWLLKHLDISAEKVKATVAATGDDSVVSVRTHGLDAMKEGRVCDKCNSGWMSRLEQAVRPILIPLIEGQRSVLALSASERLLLARWTAKTAYMLNSSSDQTSMGMRVRNEHLDFIRAHSNKLPSDVGVFCSHGPGTRDFSWIQENKWPQFFVTPVKDDLHHISGGYKIGLQIRRLLLTVASWPHAGWAFVIGAGLHVPLWPLLRFYFGYHVDQVPTSSDSYEALRWFSGTIAVVEFQFPMGPPGFLIEPQ